MSNPTAISVENLGKRYVLSHQSEGRKYVALRDVIAASIGGLFRGRSKPRASGELEDFWALKGVSFEIKQGEVVGILGSNGAGKSTLLKVLSRIVDPTEGRVQIRGRIASLLEVGTGFHPELTGRENIYLNGAILGMHRAEIRAKFDEIVAFADVERFLDTPVKRYSSGMYVRLAFAVAAHLEPEILVVDEVLAVGDAQFQKKCLGKMNDVARQGRTVLFVSHNIAALRGLCERGICLDSGRLALEAPIEEAVGHYLKTGTDKSEVFQCRKRPEPFDRRIFISDFWIEDSSGARIDKVDSMAPMTMKFVVKANAQVTAGINIRIRSRAGYVIWVDSDALQRKQFSFKPGFNHVSCEFEPLRLVSGEYAIDLLLHILNAEWIDDFRDACTFIISSFDPYGAGYDLGSQFCTYHVPHRWQS